MQTVGRRCFSRWAGILVLLVSGCVFDKNQENANDGPHVALHAAAVREAPNQAAELAAEQLKEAQQQLALSEEQRKTLSIRILQLQGVLEEKDAALQQASRELQSASAEIVRTREELQRWKQETAALRERLRRSEEETLNALQSVVPALERMGNNK
jgi:endonuclease/exonuclease/phosphatase (EEP) superfamily protein YafD